MNTCFILDGKLTGKPAQKGQSKKEFSPPNITALVINFFASDLSDTPPLRSF